MVSNGVQVALFCYDLSHRVFPGKAFPEFRKFTAPDQINSE